MAEFASKKRLCKILLNLIIIFAIPCLSAQLQSSNPGFPLTGSNPKPPNYDKVTHENTGCKAIKEYENKQEKCSYVKYHQDCEPRGYIPYLQLFYCTFSPVLGYISLTVWLLLLFYLLADTASNYFCYSLAGLSKVLKLSPTIAGLSLLSLGNGAPDVFASIISFSGNGTADIGLNSVLGGGFFVSCVVVGVISISVGDHGGKISRASFIRNVLFLLLSLSCLLLIILVGRVTLWGSLCFLSLYLIYAFFSFMCERTCADEVWSPRDLTQHLTTPAPPDRHAAVPKSPMKGGESSLTKNLFKEDQDGSRDLDSLLAQESSNSSDGIESQIAEPEGDFQPLAKPSKIGDVGLRDQVEVDDSTCNKILWILELPLDLPRRLTIPVVSEQKWSRPFAVLSVTLAPITLALAWDFEDTKSRVLSYAIGGSIGIVSGILAIRTTERFNPPSKCLIFWLVEGFIMSITWTYILAQELISLLVALGLILGLNHSILGLTVLAWGNSLGDLVANVTMARKGGPYGAQVAISGSYAGPIFNTVVGLGLSLTFSAWTTYPAPFSVSVDHDIFETIGFFIVGLLWALLILTMRKMRLDLCLGIGLLVIYLGFLSFKVARSFGLVEGHVPPS